MYWTCLPAAGRRSAGAHGPGPVGPGKISQARCPRPILIQIGPIWSSRNKSQMAPNEKVCFYDKLGLRSKHRVKLNLLIVEITFLQKV